MTDDEQKRIFSRNLNRYIRLNQKQQKEVAEAIGEKPTTLNMWCSGNTMPKPSKVRKLADYFRIGFTDLTEDKNISDSELEYANRIMKLALTDRRFAKIIIGYFELPTDKRDLICDFFEKFIL